MADVHTPEQRRRNMAAIRGRDTQPEMTVRRMLHRMGYRYRLHRKDLPGRPDLVFPGRRKIIEVRGCYWHMHDCPWGRVTPKTHAELWQSKRTATVTRDERNLRELERSGWAIQVVWECETRDKEALRMRLVAFLEPPPTPTLARSTEEETL